MTSARLTISTASDRWRALRFNSRLSGGAKTTLPKLMPTNIQHTHNESLTYCTRVLDQQEFSHGILTVQNSTQRQEILGD